MYVDVNLNSLHIQGAWKSLLKMQDLHLKAKIKANVGTERVFLWEELYLHRLTVFVLGFFFSWSEMTWQAVCSTSWFSCHSPKWAAKSILTKSHHSTVSFEGLLANKKTIRTGWNEAWNFTAYTFFSCFTSHHIAAITIEKKGGWGDTTYWRTAGIRLPIYFFYYFIFFLTCVNLFSDLRFLIVINPKLPAIYYQMKIFNCLTAITYIHI